MSADPVQPGFCHQCGSQMELRDLPGDTVRRSVCGRCGFVRYENPKVVVACALHESGRVLWIRRATPPYKGNWSIPSGFVECGETLSQAACREVREETHLQIKPEQLTLYGVLSLPEIDQVYVAFLGPLPAHDYRPSAEALDVRLFSRDELASLKLGYPPATLELVMSVCLPVENGVVQVEVDGLIDLATASGLRLDQQLEIR